LPNKNEIQILDTRHKFVSSKLQLEIYYIPKVMDKNAIEEDGGGEEEEDSKDEESEGKEHSPKKNGAKNGKKARPAKPKAKAGKGKGRRPSAKASPTKKASPKKKKAKDTSDDEEENFEEAPPPKKAKGGRGRPSNAADSSEEGGALPPKNGQCRPAAEAGSAKKPAPTLKKKNTTECYLCHKTTMLWHMPKHLESHQKCGMCNKEYSGINASNVQVIIIGF
jgi:hypothetical protein